jgi:DNA-binding GntR family transcriptional regulator
MSTVRQYRTTPDLIAEELRGEIRRGVLAGGTPLRQEELAQRFGVSRLPVRDALLRLEAQGLVIVYPNRGAVVATLSPAEVEEIFDLRILLETDAIARAVPRMTEQDILAIETARQAADLGAGGADWARLDQAFHLSLYTPSNRPRQLAMIETLRGTAERYWAAYSWLPSQTREWLRDHDAIAAACRARDADSARDVLASHLRRAGDLVMSRLTADR